MIFGGIQKNSTIDYPGVLSCVLFTRGCNLDCFYCHNRGLLRQGETIDEGEIMSFLRRRRGLLEGVVVSGGEPTLQPDLKSFIKELKNMDYSVKLDTNGQLPEIVDQLCKENLLDYVALDIKALPKDFKRVCGGENGFDKVNSTLKILSESGVDFEVRTTLYPSMTIDDLTELLGHFSQMPRWRLNYFRMPLEIKEEDDELLNSQVLTKSQILQAYETLKNIQPNIMIDA